MKQKSSVLTLAATLLLASVPGRSSADNKLPHILPPSSHAFGETYPEWIVAHARWQFEAPPSEPLDEGFGQQGHVWLLPGAGGGFHEIHAVVSPGKALLIPVSASFCSVSEGDGTTEQELRDCAQSWEDLNTVVILEIDGQAVPDLDLYRFQTGLFDLVWPEGNDFGLPAGADLLVTDGTFLLINPLKKGNHTIHRHVEASDGYVSDVIWNLTIE